MPARVRAPVSSVPLPAARRGRLRIARVRLSTAHPFGLFRVWTWVHAPLEVWVYPRPLGRLPMPVYGELQSGRQARPAAGTDEWSGLRPFRDGDSPRAVDWKAYAREAPLLVKEYCPAARPSCACSTSPPCGSPTPRRGCASWRAGSWTRRHRASATACVLPGLRLEPDRGPEHRHRCLAALAALRTRARGMSVPASRRRGGRRARLAAAAAVGLRGARRRRAAARRPRTGLGGTAGSRRCCCGAWPARGAGAGRPALALRALLALALVVLVLARFRTLNGLAAGTTLLILMAGLKLLETRTRRDYFVLVGTGLFLLLAACLDRQDLAARAAVRARGLGVLRGAGGDRRPGPGAARRAGARRARAAARRAARGAAVRVLSAPAGLVLGDPARPAGA